MNKRNRCSAFRPFAVAAVLMAAVSAAPSQAQVGQLLWEDNFDNLNTDYWNIIEGNGCQLGANLCGWGNQELEYYQADNVSIEPVPGEPGNSALVLEARAENVEGSAFSSGKLDSRNAVAIQYGMIETRIRVPDLETGLWPAFWMLGTSTASWPAKGEIDIMEMGHRQETINQFHPGATPNRFVGSNAIFYSEDACVEGNPTCAAMTAWQTDNAYVPATPMNDRFMIYRLYWTDESLRFTVVDNGVEYDMYDAPVGITDEADEFRAPFYLLMNLAVGGNFTDAAQNSEVTAPLPAKMYIDYVRVYEYQGMGEVILGDIAQPEVGTFGVFTDETPTDNKLEAGSTSDIYIWSTGSLTGGSEPAYEGEHVISWDYTAPGQWFGGGILSRQPLNMSNFAEGSLTFRIKIPADVSFKIGITDTYTNEHYIEFPAGETRYGLVRNGEWGRVTIPVEDLRGPLVAIQSLAYPFVFLNGDEMPSSAFSVALDDILWQGGGSSAADSVKIQAEDYVSFLDTDPGNNGGAYRTDDVDIEATGDTDGGYNVGWTRTGEWLEYDTSLAAGTYQVTARVAALNDGGALSVGINGAFTPSVPVNSTGSWQSWQSLVLGNLDVAAGTASVRVNVDSGGFNLNWLALERVELDGDGDGVSDGQDLCPETPAGAAVNQAGCATGGVQLQAEDYLSYYDTSSGNRGGAYRSDDVDIEATSDTGGGYNVGWIVAGEWLEYNAELAAGSYRVTARLAANGSGGSLSVDVDGVSTGSVDVGDTGGWQSWVTRDLGRISVADGVASVRVNAVSTPFNINWLALTPEDSPEDSDGDGVADDLDQCPGTASGADVDPNGCPVNPYDGSYGVNETAGDTLEFYLNTLDWADLHYTVNGGGQMNVAMLQSGGRNTYSVSGLAAGDVVAYSFTYWDADTGGRSTRPGSATPWAATPAPTRARIRTRSVTAMATVWPMTRTPARVRRRVRRSTAQAVR